MTHPVPAKAASIYEEIRQQRASVRSSQVATGMNHPKGYNAVHARMVAAESEVKRLRELLAIECPYCTACRDEATKRGDVVPF